MYRRVLLPLDGSTVAEQALDHAMAQAEGFGAELILLRVLEPFPAVRGLSHSSLARLREDVGEWTREYLERVAERPRQRGIPVQVATVEGPPHMAILQHAEVSNADLIVICTRGRSGFSRWLMGSVADRVVRGAGRPVLLVRATNVEESKP